MPWVVSLCCSGEKCKDEGPGCLIGLRPRALVRSACGRRMCRPFMPAFPRRCPVLWEGGLGLLQEPTYRLYNCRRCAAQVLICAQCDHGNIYCGQECSRLSRRESLRRAGTRYQHTRCGAARHAARQSAWRARHPKVTHQRSSRGVLECSVLTHQLRLSESTDAAVVDPKQTTSGDCLGRCTFCGAELPAWTRLRLWQWGG